MGIKTFFYGLWCLAVAAGFLAATNRAWSPFAEGRRASGGGYAGGVYVGGPRHK